MTSTIAVSITSWLPGTDLNAGRYYNIWQLSADYRISPQLKIGGSAAPSANLVGDAINGRGLTGLQAGILQRF